MNRKTILSLILLILFSSCQNDVIGGMSGYYDSSEDDDSPADAEEKPAAVLNTQSPDNTQSPEELNGLSEQEAVNEAIDALEIVYQGGDGPSSITGDLGLANEGLHETVISWDTSGHSRIDGDGRVERSNGGTEWWNGSGSRVRAEITATVSRGETSGTKTFALSVLLENGPPVPSGFTGPTLQFGRRFIRFPKPYGGDYIGNYEVQYREFSGGSWSGWRAISGATISTSSSPVKFGWAEVHLARGHYQFRFRVTRNGVTGDWGVTPEYPSF
jgi:hypothetical protein